MPEKKIRSILLGLLLWMLIFAAYMAAAIKLDEENVSIFILIVIPILVVILSYIYMHSSKDKSVYEGTRLGFTWLVLLLTLDVIVRTYIMEYGWEYFRSGTIWIAYGEIVFLCSVIGALSKPVKEEIAAQTQANQVPSTEEKSAGDTYFSK